MKGWKHKLKTNVVVGNESKPTKVESGQVIINKKATKKNLDRLIEINNDGLESEKEKVTTDGTDGGLLKGKPHYDKNGNPLGGIPMIVDNSKKIEAENDEFLLNKEASKKHWKELSKINQSEGNGVPINPQDVGADDDPQEFKQGGVIDFNPNHLPRKAIYNYAKMVKEKYPKVWDLGGNIFGNEAFKNLERVLKRGYWTENEEWMYIKWRSYVARHKGDFRIAGVIAMLKWVDKVDKGWEYMKNLIEKEIQKRYPKKKTGGITKKNLTYLGEVGGSRLSESERIDWGKNEFDNKQRFEISDKELEIIADLDSILKEVLLEQKVVTIPLYEFIYHPILFKAYPEFKNIPVNFVYTKKNLKAAIRPDYENNKIYFLFNIKQLENETGIRHLSSYEERQSIRRNERYRLYLPQVAHELEHIIQIREIFGGGSNPISEQNRILRENGIDPNTATEAQRAAIMVRAFDNYINKSGEIESKDVEKRLNLSLKERKEIKPFALMKIDKSKVSVLFPKELNWGQMRIGGELNNNNFYEEESRITSMEKTHGTDARRMGESDELRRRRFTLRRRVLLHELQHYAQYYENHGQGSSWEREYKRLLQENGLDERRIGTNERNLLIQRAKELNRSYLGEMEAKDAEYRIDLTLEERKNKKPFESLNYKVNSVIVKTKEMASGGAVTYKEKYNKKYGYKENESHDLDEISEDTGISEKGLQQIYNKGVGAYKTNPESVRPTVKSKEQWAMGRVYSAVMGGKAAIVDANELRMENGGKISLIDTTKYDDNGINCYWQTYSYQNSSISIDYCEGLFFKIDSISTKELDRRKGYATKLLNHVKKIAKELGFSTIQIYLPIDARTPRKEYSLKDYNVAVSFYKKNGFIFYPKSTVKMFFDLNKMEDGGGVESTSRWRPEFIAQLKPIDLNKMENGGITESHEDLDIQDLMY